MRTPYAMEHFASERKPEVGGRTFTSLERGRSRGGGVRSSIRAKQIHLKAKHDENAPRQARDKSGNAGGARTTPAAKADKKRRVTTVPYMTCIATRPQRREPGSTEGGGFTSRSNS